jgi:hypothetical protein
MTDTSIHHLTTVPRTGTADRSRWAVLAGVLALAALSVVGAVISVRSGLADSLGEAMGPTGRLSIPWPMICAQLLAGVAAASSRRWVAVVGSGFVALATTLGVVSGFFDGGYADDRLTGAEHVFQWSFVALLAVVALVAARRLVAVLRHR